MGLVASTASCCAGWKEPFVSKTYLLLTAPDDRECLRDFPDDERATQAAGLLAAAVDAPVHVFRIDDEEAFHVSRPDDGEGSAAAGAIGGSG